MRTSVIIGAVAAGIIVAGTGTGLVVSQLSRPAVAAPRAPAIDYVQAGRVALGEVPGGTIVEVDLEDDDSRNWDVSVLKNTEEHEIWVDSQSGDVIKHETDEIENDDGD